MDRLELARTKGEDGSPVTNILVKGEVETEEEGKKKKKNRGGGRWTMRNLPRKKRGKQRASVLEYIYTYECRSGRGKGGEPWRQEIGGSAIRNAAI